MLDNLARVRAQGGPAGQAAAGDGVAGRGDHRGLPPLGGDLWYMILESTILYYSTTTLHDLIVYHIIV